MLNVPETVDDDGYGPPAALESVHDAEFLAELRQIRRQALNSHREVSLEGGVKKMKDGGIGTTLVRWRCGEQHLQ